jgi:regulation of enolase protein 1 (concanavalin A-like superfamily)
MLATPAVGAVGAIPVAANGVPPTIDIWYGDVQQVGEFGRTQQWANVLGRVADTDDALASLTYSLNGGPPQPLTIGPGNNPRLARRGDFNVEIDRDVLVPGDNSVLLTAIDEAGNQTHRTITLVNAPATTWPLPTSVEWDGVSLPSDVVDVVDGLWSATADGARVVQDGYDRLLAVGDISWTDYQVEVPVTIHDIDANVGGVGLFMRWTGHTEAPPHKAGMQPRVGWQPSGALAWYRARFHPYRVELATDDEDVLAADSSGFTLEMGSTYVFRASVERTAGGDEYRITVFPAGQPESAGVTLTAVDTAFTKDAGSVLLVAHRATVTFGDVLVTEISGDPPPNVPPVAVDDVVSTLVDVPVAVDVLANDGDSDGSLVPSSVAVVDAAVSGSVAVDPGSGVVTYSPDAGFVGSDSFTYTVDDDDGATSNVASVSVTVGSPPTGALVSDEFSSSSLGSHWSWFDPVGDASVVATGTHAELLVPAGVSHDLWTGRLLAPRLLQSVDDVDFEVEVKIDSPVTAKYQMQGLVAQQDENNLIRAEVHHDGGGPRLFVATITNGQASAVQNVAAPAGAPYWLRLGRQGDGWTFKVSGDGVNWATVATFTHAMSVSQAGVFVANFDPAPQHTATIDYFRAS